MNTTRLTQRILGAAFFAAFAGAVLAQPPGGMPPLLVALDADRKEEVGAQTATHEEAKPLCVEFGSLKSIRLRADGNLLAADSEAGHIKILTPAGAVVGTINPGFKPEVLAIAADGTVFCGGKGQVARLDSEGRVVRQAEIPKPETPATPSRRAAGHPPGISGLAVSKKDLFVTFGSGWSTGAKAKLFRFNRDLQKPMLIAEGLRACCQHADLLCVDGKLILAENAAYRVVQYDRQGEVLAKWGSKSRDDLSRFGSCCNPMNIAIDAEGTLYTAEAGLGRVKRYSLDGKFLGLVGYLDVERFSRGGRLAASCCHIPIAVTPNGDLVYVVDVKENLIRVLRRKDSKPGEKVAQK